MTTTTTGGLRCHNPEACYAGQKPCPSPAACGVAAPAPHKPGAQWVFNALYADTEVRSVADDRLLAVIHAGPERARIVSLLKSAPQSKALPSDAEIEALREAFDWDGWTDPNAAQRGFARAVLARWGAAPQPPDEPSPEFTDTARAALLWVLWHHQGAGSPVGQPIRFALGMGQHDRLEPHRLAEAKRWERLHPVNPSVWAPRVRPLTAERIEAIWVEHGLDDCDPEGFARRIEADHGITGTTDGKQT